MRRATRLLGYTRLTDKEAELARLILISQPRAEDARSFVVLRTISAIKVRLNVRQLLGAEVKRRVCAAGQGTIAKPAHRLTSKQQKGKRVCTVDGGAVSNPTQKPVLPVEKPAVPAAKHRPRYNRRQTYPRAAAEIFSSG